MAEKTETVKKIREQDPLKQGLKPRVSRITTPAGIIREQDPLKQGLKPPYYRVAD